MNKTYAPKRYELKTVGNFIQDKSVEEKQQIKARELAKVNLPKDFTYKGISIHVIYGPVESQGKLYIAVEASSEGKKLFIDNPLIYLNPPIMVHDGTYHKRLNSNNELEDFPNYVEDLETALKQIIIQTVEVLNP